MQSGSGRRNQSIRIDGPAIEKAVGSPRAEGQGGSDAGSLGPVAARHRPRLELFSQSQYSRLSSSPSAVLAGVRPPLFGPGKRPWRLPCQKTLPPVLGSSKPPASSPPRSKPKGDGEAEKLVFSMGAGHRAARRLPAQKGTQRPKRRVPFFYSISPKVASTNFWWVRRERALTFSKSSPMASVMRRPYSKSAR